MSTDTASPTAIACTPATAAPAGSFSPMRRATIAVVERLSPNPIANTRLSSDSVSPTVATASAPNRPTQKTSTTANSDSKTISRTIGMARSNMARFRLPVVKSWCDPRSASRIEPRLRRGRDGLFHFHKILRLLRALFSETKIRVKWLNSSNMVEEKRKSGPR